MQVYPRGIIDAETSTEILRADFVNPESYYIVVVNGGMHWVGVTETTVYDSLGAAPVVDSSGFGKLNGDPDESNYNSFTGLVMEIQKQ